MSILGQTRTPLGFVMTFLKNDCFIGDAYSRGQHWEQNLVNFLSKCLSGDKNSLDIGAHIGTHTVVYAKSSKFVYSFEMQPEVYRILLKNVLNNCLTNVVAQCTAISYEDGVGHIGWGEGESGPNTSVLSYTDGKPRNYGGIQLTSEGVVVNKIKLPHIKDLSLVKVDVEGFEPCVFYAMKEMIKESKPVITFERNWKAIGEKLKKELGIPEEIAEFSIENFTRINGYGPVVIIDDEHNLLLCYNHPCLKEIVGRWETIVGTSTISPKSNGCYEIFLEEGSEVRGPYRVVSLTSKRICMFIKTSCQPEDRVTYFVADIEGDIIRWENNTTWTRTGN